MDSGGDIRLNEREKGLSVFGPLVMCMILCVIGYFDRGSIGGWYGVIPMNVYTHLCPLRPEYAPLRAYRCQKSVVADNEIWILRLCRTSSIVAVKK